MINTLVGLAVSFCDVMCGVLCDAESIYTHCCKVGTQVHNVMCCVMGCVVQSYII